MLILVRHGETAANASGLLLGRADPPLTERGAQQAGALARALPRPARVIASPLTRTRDTAAAFGVDVEVDERWIEMDYGDYDGVALGDVPADVWARWRSDLDFTPPGGESTRAVGERVRAACGDLLEAAADLDVVVVSHVSPIKAAVAWALGAGDEVVWRLRLSVASVTRVAVGPAGPTLTSFNEIAHL